jgi:hypothetical protein
MSLSEKSIEEFKEIYRKEYGKELSQAEAFEAANNLVNFFRLLVEQDEKDQRRKIRLKDEPKGFHIEGNGYSCFICGNSISNEETWYDKHGIKCLLCQKTINKHQIPATAASKKDSWYSQYDLESRFNIDRHAMKRLVKEGALKPRIVPNANGTPHVYLFLLKDNKDTLPPKKLTESQLVKETKDGKEWHHSEPWYRFVDPTQALKDYKIMDYLRVVTVPKDTSKNNPNK